MENSDPDGVLLGLAQAAKFTSLLLYPILIIISIWDSDTRKRMKTIKYWGELSGICLLSLFMIMACYRFDRIFFPMDSLEATYSLFQWLKQILPDDLLIPFPYHYVKGLDIQLGSAARFSNYLNGVFCDHGVWYYYLEAFIIKNPIPFLIVLLGGMVILIQKIKSCPGMKLSG